MKLRFIGVIGILLAMTSVSQAQLFVGNGSPARRVDAFFARAPSVDLLSRNERHAFGPVQIQIEGVCARNGLGTSIAKWAQFRWPFRDRVRIAVLTVIFTTGEREIRVPVVATSNDRSIPAVLNCATSPMGVVAQSPIGVHWEFAMQEGRHAEMTTLLTKLAEVSTASASGGSQKLTAASRHLSSAFPASNIKAFPTYNLRTDVAGLRYEAGHSPAVAIIRLLGANTPR